MKPFMVHLFLLCLLPASVVAVNNCSVPPLLLPLKNNTLDDGVALNRGVPVTLGGQPEGFRTTFTLNNTRIRNAQDCDLQGGAANATGCEGASGGVFDIDNTFAIAPDGTWNVSTIDPPPAGATVLQGYDLAFFPGNISIPQFPFEVWSNSQATNKSALALGPSSSVLSILLAIGAIPSKTMGLFFGSRSQNQPADGQWVIGGYDASRVAGPFHNYTIGAGYLGIPCPLQVLVKDVRLTTLNGTFSLFADAGAIVPTCIDPLQNEFTFTQAMYTLFANLTNHPSNPPGDGSANYTTQTYPASAADFIQNLTVQLSDGFTVTIPHYEFLSQERGTDAEGKYAVVNASRAMVAASTGLTDYGVDVPLLGGVFLSQTYLKVDYDSGTFSLAPAALGNVGPSNIISTCVGGATHAPSTGGHKSNAGAIAGGVVGGFAGLALVGAAVWYFGMRKRGPQKEVEEVERKDSTLELAKAGLFRFHRAARGEGEKQGALGDEGKIPRVEKKTPGEEEEIPAEKEKIPAEEEKIPATEENIPAMMERSPIDGTHTELA